MAELIIAILRLEKKMSLYHNTEIAVAKGLSLATIKMEDYQKLVKETTAAVPYIP